MHRVRSDGKPPPPPYVDVQAIGRRHVTRVTRMHLTVCALLCFWIERAAASSGTLTVRVDIDFGRANTSPMVQTLAKNEAAALCGVYRVDLRWGDQDAVADLCLSTSVERSSPAVDGRGLSVLARTTIAPEPTAHPRGPIRISFDAVAALLEARFGAQMPFHDVAIGLAIGRVLAHEIGHVLLGAPGYHDQAGLMRATFLTDDLARFDRSGFRLADTSVARLRERIEPLRNAVRCN